MSRFLLVKMAMMLLLGLVCAGAIYVAFEYGDYQNRNREYGNAEQIRKGTPAKKRGLDWLAKAILEKPITEREEGIILYEKLLDEHLWRLKYYRELHERYAFNLQANVPEGKPTLPSANLVFETPTMVSELVK